MDYKVTGFEAYEDNGGGIYLVLFLIDEPMMIFENWEYGEKGQLKEAIRRLAENPEECDSWEGNLLKRLNNEGGKIVFDGMDVITGETYSHREDWEIMDLYLAVADNDNMIAGGKLDDYEIYEENMGGNGHHVFGIDY